MKNGLGFVNVLYLLAKLAWWQLFLEEEERTCLGEWLNRWDGQLCMAWLAQPQGPPWHLETPRTEEKPNTQSAQFLEGQSRSILTHLKKCLVWSHASSRRLSWGTLLWFPGKEICTVPAETGGWPWTQQPQRLGCHGLLFSHFKSGAVRALVLQIWAEKQDMWLGGWNQKLKHLTTGELITLGGNPFRF